MSSTQLKTSQYVQHAFEHSNTCVFWHWRGGGEAWGCGGLADLVTSQILNARDKTVKMFL